MQEKCAICPRPLGNDRSKMVQGLGLIHKSCYAGLVAYTKEHAEQIITDPAFISAGQPEPVKVA